MSDMQDLFPINTGFLSIAPDALKTMMTRIAVKMRLGAGDVLFEQGQQGDTFYAIISGKLEFSVISVEGKKLSLDVMHKGALFGEITLFDPGPRTATVTALEPSLIWGVKHDDVLQELWASPELGIAMIQLAGQRMRWMGRQLNEQVFLSLEARLARKVIHLTSHDSNSQPVLGLSQAELSEFVGASREAVSKTLAGWGRSGHISLVRGGLRVLNKSALKQLAEFAKI